MRLGFESAAGAVCSIKESSGSQNLRVSIVIKASKPAVSKGDVPKIFRHFNYHIQGAHRLVPTFDFNS